MTLVEALKRIHGAGKSAAVWRPGMRVVAPAMFAGWLPGRAHEDGRWRWDEGRVWEDGPGNAEIDTEDPATIGCLAATAREVWGQPGLYASFGPLNGAPCWVVVGKGWMRLGATEGEAWANAIILAAEELS